MVTKTAGGKGEGLSLTTFGLWAALAWITSVTMFKQGANPAVPTIYAVGATATTVVLLLKGKCQWSGFDTLIAAMVAICVWLWLTSGPRNALIMSVVATLIAGTPFIVMTWKNPAHSPIVPNAAFLVANTLAFVSAKDWTLEDRLFAGVNVGVCGMLVLPWLLF